MKEIIALIILVLFISGCAGVIERGSYVQVSAPMTENAYLTKGVIIKVYDYSFDIVYKAITNLLEKRLRFNISRKYTTNDTIFSCYTSAFTTRGAYVYLFRLKNIDANHTEVSLRAKGTWNTISDNDMLNKYIPEELAYVDRIK